MAPHAHILYVGAQDCLDNRLFTAEQNVIDNRLADVVTNSWGDTGGDLLDDAATKTAFDDLFLLADATGITVQFSSGDDGDNFESTSASRPPDYPTSSPYVTAVGGTTLKIGVGRPAISASSAGTPAARSCAPPTSRRLLGCTAARLTPGCPPRSTAVAAGTRATTISQPFYQAPVVPSSLARRDRASPVPRRESFRTSRLDADPRTGFLIGLHQTFPDGTSQYDQPGTAGPASPRRCWPASSPMRIRRRGAGRVHQPDDLPAGRESTRRRSTTSCPSRGSQGNYRVRITPDRRTGLGQRARRLVPGAVLPRPRDVLRRDRELRQPPGARQSAAPGYDSLTGLGSPGTNFIDALAGF